MIQHQAGFAGVPAKRLKQTALTWKGAVHKVRHAILANFDPHPSPVTLCHTSRDPQKYVTHLGLPLPPIFSRPNTKNRDKSPLYKFSLNCSWGFLSGGFVFCLEGFVRSPFSQNACVTTES